MLNHAKLLSTYAQLLAFQGQHVAAQSYFEQALNGFSLLSEPKQAQRESQQTQIYQLINFMDSHPQEPELIATSVLKHMVKWVKKTKADEISRSLAYSGASLRYVHHLWLRCLVLYPDYFHSARHEYLQQRHQWQTGEDHPWSLIEAYRAWLLKMDKQSSLATEHLDQALYISTLEESGLTLLWIAEVLRTLAYILGIPNQQTPTATERQRLQQQLLYAPHAKLEQFAQNSSSEHQALCTYLRQCLPFNFH